MNDLNSFVDAFECAQAQGPAEVADFLPRPEHPSYGVVLRELVRVDLEYRWQRRQPRCLEEYQSAFPELFRDSAVVAELAFEEYRLRQQAGQQPTRDEYQRRFQIDPNGWPTLAPEQPNAAAASGTYRHDGAWEILERFLKEMQSCDENQQQIRLVLQAVRDSLGADAVFHWFADATAPALELAGPAELTTSWCRTFAQQTIARQGAGNGELLLPSLSLPIAAAGPTVRSAALIRIGKSMPSWVAALSFGKRRFEPADLKVMQLARRMLLGQRQYAQTYSKLKDALFSLIRCLTTMIDARDRYTCGHSERVARIAVRLGKQMGLPSRVQSDLYLAGLLHDIGKIGIQDSVLLKEGKLSLAEFKHIQEHVVIGDRILGTVKQLASLRPGVRHHHERFDGRGYPDRLVGKSIPLQARILAIADACDAMMSTRHYRPAIAPEQIDRVMTDGAGSQWDAELIQHFMACRQELYLICQRGLGHSVLHAVADVLQTGEEGSSLAAEFNRTPLAVEGDSAK